ncbi:MAG: DNA repair protein RadC [Clostridia bacterium]|nr:DNA repair protein RadC [Clostridia bacterium]
MNNQNASPNQPSQEPNPENYHIGHRERLKKRFLNEGLDHFEPHEVLELVLFYVIPKQDTNMLAHRLLVRFGSLSGVLEADAEELMSVKGIGANAAVFLKLFPAVFRQYELSRLNADGIFDTLEKVGNYAKSLFIGATVERVYLLLFNNKLQLLETYFVADGSVNHAPILPRVVAERAIVKQAASILLVHNHPHGNPLPTRDDIETTHTIDAACKLLGIHFLDHLIVTEQDFISILRSQKGLTRPSPLTGQSDTAFFQRYYGLEDKPET